MKGANVRNCRDAKTLCVKTFFFFVLKFPGITEVGLLGNWYGSKVSTVFNDFNG